MVQVNCTSLDVTALPAFAPPSSMSRRRAPLTGCRILRELRDTTYQMDGVVTSVSASPSSSPGRQNKITHTPTNATALSTKSPQSRVIPSTRAPQTKLSPINRSLSIDRSIQSVATGLTAAAASRPLSLPATRCSRKKRASMREQRVSN